jgi:hypothetical protein
MCRCDGTVRGFRRCARQHAFAGDPHAAWIALYSDVVGTHWSSDGPGRPSRQPVATTGAPHWRTEAFQPFALRCLMCHPEAQRRHHPHGPAEDPSCFASSSRPDCLRCGKPTGRIIWPGYRYLGVMADEAAAAVQPAKPGQINLRVQWENKPDVYFRVSRQRALLREAWAGRPARGARRPAGRPRSRSPDRDRDRSRPTHTRRS